MKVAIVYETRTGTTAAAAEKMAEVVRAAGHECSVANISGADARAVGRADALVFGCWTQGYFIFRQHPSDGIIAFLDGMSINHRPVAVFATYRLAVGPTVRLLASAVERSGGKVTGLYQVKGPKVPAGFDGWVATLGTGI